MCGTPIKDAARPVNLPLKVLRQLHKDGIIGDPVSDADLRGLAILAEIWGKVWYIRKMMAPLSMDYRRRIWLTPELSGPERYALSCYLNAKEGERILVKDIIGKVKHYLNVPLTKKQVTKVREIAYDIRRGRRLDPRKKVENNLEMLNDNSGNH
jgi:hypothetical protein